MSVNFSNFFQVLGLLTWGVLLFAGTTHAGCTRMNIFDRNDGTGEFTRIRVLQPPYRPTCINLQPGTTWHSRATALRMTANIGCIKVCNSNDCTGQCQCVCQKNHRVLTSWDRIIVPGTNALSFGNCDSSKIGGTIEVFEDENFGGASETLQIPEGQCDSLRNDEDWKDKISSLRVTQGCVEYYDQAGCTGNKNILSKDSEFDYGYEANQVEALDSTWNNRVRSFKSCSEPPAPGPAPEVSV